MHIAMAAGTSRASLTCQTFALYSSWLRGLVWRSLTYEQIPKP